MVLRFRSLCSLFLLCCFAATSQAATLMNVQLTVTDSEDNLVTDLKIGDDFFLKVFVQDTRGSDAAGVFSSYVDATYDSTIAIPTGPITHADLFANGTSGDLSVLGLVDEAGGFGGSFSLLAPGEPQLVWSLPMTAIAPGRIEFTSNLADDLPTHETLLFDSLDFIGDLGVGDINFGTTVLGVQAVPEPEHSFLTMLLIGIVASPFIRKQ